MKNSSRIVECHINQKKEVGGMTKHRYSLKIFTLKVREEESPLPQNPIQSSEHAKQYLQSYFIEERDDRERMIALCLSAKYRVQGIAKISEGASNMVIVDSKVIFRTLLCMGCYSFILAHNHPSGDPTPSPEDFTITRRLREGGQLLDLQCLDHLIFGDGTNAVYSFQDHNQFSY